MSINQSSFPWFFFSKVARLQALFFFVGLLGIVLVYRHTLKNGLMDQVGSQIHESLESNILSWHKRGLKLQDWCEGLGRTKQVRYTLSNEQGHILCDSSPKTKQGNLTEKPEFKLAREQGFAQINRSSGLFRGETVHAVLRLEENGQALYVRKSVPLAVFASRLDVIDRTLLTTVLPLSLVLYFIFLWAFASISRPLRSILRKVEQLQIHLPHQQQLKLFYKKDEWAAIEAALDEADQKLKDQVSHSRSETEKFQTLLASIYDEIIAIDLQQNVLFTNGRFEKTFLAKSDKVAKGRKLWSVLDDQELLNAFEKCMRQNAPVSIKSWKIPSATPVRYMDITLSPLSDEGIICGVIAVFHDATEARLTEQMRVDFVANVSHEIRTPMTSIKGYSQLLKSQKDKFPTDLHEFIDRILQNTERMISLFNDLLELSVIEGKQSLQRADVSLTELIGGIKHDMKSIYQSKNITIEKDLTIDQIQVDPKLFRQVIVNLIDNACKYSGDTPHIRIHSNKIGENVEIKIHDNGPGIASEHLGRIFERFYRIDNARDRAAGGTGLGLSIVKHIVMKHGGKICAKAGEPTGTVFVIEIPIA